MTISHGKEAVLWRANQQQNIPMTRRRKDLTSSNPPIIQHWPTTEKGHQTNGERKERLEHSKLIHILFDTGTRSPRRKKDKLTARERKDSSIAKNTLKKPDGGKSAVNSESRPRVHEAIREVYDRTRANDRQQD